MNGTNKKLSWFLALLVTCQLCFTAQAETWEQYIDREMDAKEKPILQNRQIKKAGKIMLVGPSGGFSDRNDFYTTPTFSLAGRYFFSETMGIEFFRIFYSMPIEQQTAKEITAQTDFAPDIQWSRFQISTAFVWAPIYGKYSFSDASLVHFDLHSVIGLGLRFARDDLQPYLDLGVGMSHSINRWLSIVPQYNLRGYMEQRSSNVFVLESVVQLGAAWTL